MPAEPENPKGNPYEAPGTAAAPPQHRPKIAPWVLLGLGLGAACGAAVELLGLARLTPAADGNGLGGAIVGGLTGTLIGRMIGRLLVAQHSFQKAAHRRTEICDELDERRTTRRSSESADDDPNG